jgi:hypothetical protein
VTFSADPDLARLKRFQQRTAEYVFDRFYGRDPVDRFLVADEVGLGKTLVARGVVAKLIERLLAETDRRIDVVYVCSNQAIAQQNFSKLAVVGTQRQPVVDRVTTLPLHVRHLNRKIPKLGRGVNFIPITPTTSLDLRSNVGRKDERALLWWMLGHMRLFGRRFMERKGVWRALSPPAGDWGFRTEKESIDEGQIDRGLWNHFAKQLLDDDRQRGDQSALAQFERVANELRWEWRAKEDPWASRRTAAVGELRRRLADACIGALEPDLVILDEFQRFPQIMRAGHPAAELAERLFRYPDVKVLLLSATPYRMLSRAREAGDDHYTEFIQTTGFLLDDDERLHDCEEKLREFRAALRAAPGDGGSSARVARDALASKLTRVMCRTERLASTEDRQGMLDPEPPHALRPQLKRGDLTAFRELDDVARSLGARDVVEYWKSTPYALNLMDEYKLVKDFERLGRAGKVPTLSSRLDGDAIKRYAAVDPANARLRGLLSDLEARGAWQLLWLPPSLPYFEPGPPFDRSRFHTKALLFSAWHVVPKAVSALASYEADRRIFTDQFGAAAPTNDSKGRQSLGQPLRWQARGSLTELVLSLPSPGLAELVDPLELSAELGGVHGPVALSEALRLAQHRIKRALRPFLSSAKRSGSPDFTWYAIAPLLLHQGETCALEEWLQPEALAELSEDDDWEGLGIWANHVERIHESIADPTKLGPPPRGLIPVLAHQALAAPGTAVFRALKRADPSATQRERLQQALKVGDAFRRLFNLPEVVALVRAPARRRRRPPAPGGPNVYWRRALTYCLHGNIQAVLDEYAHVLRDWVEDRPGAGGKTAAIGETMSQCVAVHAADLEARELTGHGRVRARRLHLRTRFGLRIDSRGEDEGSVRRIDAVRRAFNSPFWPFVLATTSVGQEGLDFHQYAHAVIHWNLPSNPVDLEQREGRVHRYKGHAIRRNLAAEHRADAFGHRGDDPWEAMFEKAPHADEDLQPYWVFRGDAKIERHVLALPLSSDHQRLQDLVRLLGVYRLAFGQPRQDELLAVLAEHWREEWADLLLDLRPPPAPA